jgi:hypothetical protein
MNTRHFALRAALGTLGLGLFVAAFSLLPATAQTSKASTASTLNRIRFFMHSPRL